MRTRSTTPRNWSSRPTGSWMTSGCACSRSTIICTPCMKSAPDPVHLVDEGYAWDPVLVGLPPYGLGLRLDAGHRAEQGDGPVEHAQRPLHFHSEVHVPGCVYDVDAMITPFARRSRRRDGDAPLLLLGHPVHHSGAVVHLADLVGTARVVQHPLGGRGLTGIDVSHDADVADHSQRMSLSRLRVGFMCCCLCQF